MRWICVLLLAGCAAGAEPAVLVIPEELRSCPRGVPQVAAPAGIRSVQTIADAYNQAKAAGLATEAALRECSDRLDRLVRLMGPSAP